MNLGVFVCSGRRRNDNFSPSNGSFQVGTFAAGESNQQSNERQAGGQAGD